ncbi:hypothetical protein FGO68_gene14727 [Halteria grandinella]|uniref:Secreted protein n=1 Tax=Halteria grandinella TaxID=5974 RepID=A0A8J8NWK5_HALGN|nr:hypothetical protein FGO68_gene14727 [Halteria grandinella]
MPYHPLPLLAATWCCLTTSESSPSWQVGPISIFFLQFMSQSSTLTNCLSHFANASVDKFIRFAESFSSDIPPILMTMTDTGRLAALISSLSAS